MDEKKIIEKAKKGDEQAFNELAVIYKPYIQRISRRYFLIGGDMEDILQEGLIGMYKAVMSYDLDSKVAFKTFAYLCINSQIKTCISQSNRKGNKALNNSVSVDNEMEDEDAWAVILISDELSPEEELIKRQKVKEIIKEMNQVLKPIQKQILKLYFNNYSYVEIAKVIGKDTKFVDNNLTQIKKKLAHLKENEEL